jgi:hypothetical protein
MASATSARVPILRAFSTSGRLKVIVAIPSSTSNKISSYAMFHLSFAKQLSIPRAVTAQSIRIEFSLHVKKKPAEKIYPFFTR